MSTAEKLLLINPINKLKYVYLQTGEVQIRRGQHDNMREQKTQKRYKGN